MLLQPRMEGCVERRLQAVVFNFCLARSPKVLKLFVFIYIINCFFLQLAVFSFSWMLKYGRTGSQLFLHLCMIAHQNPLYLLLQN